MEIRFKNYTPICILILLSFLLSVSFSEESLGRPGEEEIRRKVELLERENLKHTVPEKKAVRPSLKKLQEALDRSHHRVVDTASVLFTLTGVGFDEQRHMYAESLAGNQEQLKRHGESCTAEKCREPLPYFPESAVYSKKLLLDYPDFPRNDEVLYLILSAYIEYGNGSTAEFFKTIWPEDDPAWIIQRVINLRTGNMDRGKKLLTEYCKADFCYQTGRRRRAGKLFEELLRECDDDTDSQSVYCAMAEKYLREKFRR
ncbi:MAG: hypothetical protein ACOC36_07235 [Fibrobacterota bacterium]